MLCGYYEVGLVIGRIGKNFYAETVEKGDGGGVRWGEVEGENAVGGVGRY
jgi:hypothetical protein